MGVLRKIAILALATAPSAALACGGLFCNTAQPVNQAAERILFARDGATVHMHVRLTWAGPPSEFGWLLPVPPDVRTELSSEELFRRLDQGFAPLFVLQTEFEEGCPVPRAAADGGVAAQDAGADAPGGVQVLSREAVGPYDRAILRAEDVGVLRAWLSENGYQLPAGGDDRLAPYIELGAVFVALKLRPGSDSRDVQPLHLSFTSPRPAIPLRPTAVAAQPDMGVVVHVLGDARAVPVNYRHVQINEAAIDWPAGGDNYADVVSQAVDEAGGRAFATDFAGPHAGRIALAPLSAADLDAASRLSTLAQLGDSNLLFDADADIQRAIRQTLDLPPDVTADAFLSCPPCYDVGDRAFDGPALAERLRTEVNPAREHLSALFAAYPYLTRLYTTLSPDEMNEDPAFSWNVDLGDVDNVRTAVRRVGCGDDGDLEWASATVVLPSGGEVRLVDGQMPAAVRRQDGLTVRGADAMAAAVIETLPEAGQPMVDDDRRPRLPQNQPPPAETGDDDSGCAAVGGGPATFALFALLALRRRRQR